MFADPLAGRTRWTLELLAEEIVVRTGHKQVSRETVCRRLAEQSVKPWQRKMWCIPRVDAEYVARMEDVLDLYGEAPDPRRPAVCFDETPVLLIGETRIPWPAQPGGPARIDYEFGMSTLPANIEAIDALEEIGCCQAVEIVLMGGIRDGVDAVKALCLGADAVARVNQLALQCVKTRARRARRRRAPPPSGS